MAILSTRAILFSIILIVGTLTSFSDLKDKKIYNVHLGFGLALGAMALLYAFGGRHENILPHLIDALFAFVIGFLLFRFDLWRGGDAKLFTLYALLMPPTHPIYQHATFPTVISLFGCSFIAGTLILAPFFIKDTTVHFKSIIQDPDFPARLRAIRAATAAVLLSSWILFPIYFLTGAKDPIIILLVSYFFFSWGYSFKKSIQKNQAATLNKLYRISVLILFGFLMRLWLAPHTLSLPMLSGYLLRMTLSAGVSACMYTTFNYFKDYQERVPFAPLLFIGCLLSYTPFLAALLGLLNQWNALLYR